MASPAVGQELEVEVGGVALSTIEADVATSSLKLIEPLSFTGKRAGAEYIVTIPASDLRSPTIDNIYWVDNASFRYAREAKERRGISKPDIGIYVDPTNDRALKAYVSFGLSKQDVIIPDAQFKPERCMRENTRGFRSEILYSGGAKGAITLQYREYVNDFARPAFSQECQTAFKRDPRSASKKDPLADMIGVCRGEPCAACGGGRA